MNILLWFLSPIGRYVGFALAIAAIVGAIYAKGRHDDHVAYTKRIKREAEQSISKARDARSDAVSKFDSGRLRDDGFRRD